MHRSPSWISITSRIGNGDCEIIVVMTETVEIYCKNNHTCQEFPVGSSLLDIYRGFHLDLPYLPLSARVNNRSEGLDFRVYRNKEVEFLDIRDSSAKRAYVRSLCFILYKAVTDLFTKGELKVKYPVSRGYFCRLCTGGSLTQGQVRDIKKRMQEIIEEDIPYRKVECRTSEAIELFRECGMEDKVKLLESSGALYTYYYQLADTMDCYYSHLLPSTGFIDLFDVMKYEDGLLLRIPSSRNPHQLEEVVKQEKLSEVLKEYLNWSRIMGLSSVGDFNIACKAGKATELINIAEALQEKKIARIADAIFAQGKNENRVRIVLISGPSSSGKTTFSKRLAIQLMTNGLRPYSISLDDYYVDRDQTPLDENGEYDYESFEALDRDLFNRNLEALLHGEEVDIPHFDFVVGKRKYTGNHLKITDNVVLILEGIHALNPQLAPYISDKNKFKIWW
ncbi:Uridine kinase [termite gut metagenome]|uniref:Uridine kinase n=1 Tax=termite gut metagenome TaxID=433724 RepID=A0A5J4R2Y8_9ZZZZ